MEWTRALNQKTVQKYFWILIFGYVFLIILCVIALSFFDVIDLTHIIESDIVKLIWQNKFIIYLLTIFFIGSLVYLFNKSNYGIILQKIKFVIIAIAIIVGVALNLLSFQAQNNRSRYNIISREPIPTLAKLVISMPGKYPAIDVLNWFRNNAAGLELEARQQDLASAGLTDYRLIAVANMKLCTSEVKFDINNLPINTDSFISFKVYPNTKEIKIDRKAVESKSKLIAIPTEKALLITTSKIASGSKGNL